MSGLVHQDYAGRVFVVAHIGKKILLDYRSIVALRGSSEWRECIMVPIPAAYVQHGFTDATLRVLAFGAISLCERQVDRLRAVLRLGKSHKSAARLLDAALLDVLSFEEPEADAPGPNVVVVDEAEFDSRLEDMKKRFDASMKPPKHINCRSVMTGGVSTGKAAQGEPSLAVQFLVHDALIRVDPDTEIE